MLKNKMRDKYYIKEDKKKFLYPTQWNTFYSNLSDKQQPYFKIAINTGGRINEILHVTPNDFQMKDGMPTIEFRITKVKARKGEKKPTPRTIQISTELYVWIQRYVKRHGIKKDEPIVKIGKTAIAKIIKKWNIKDFSSHNIRKTHGMWLLAWRIDVMEICNRLSHSVETLRQHYASASLFTNIHKVQMADILGDLYKNERKIDF